MTRTVRVSGRALDAAEAYADALGIGLPAAVCECVLRYSLIVGGDCSASDVVADFERRRQVMVEWLGGLGNERKRRRSVRRKR